MEMMIDQNYLPTVAELLDLPIFQDARILCGEGTGHPLGGVFLSEIPDYYNWVRAGELVVTNCYALYDRSDLLRDFIPRLSSLGGCGVLRQAGSVSRRRWNLDSRLLNCRKESVSPILQKRFRMNFSAARRRCCGAVSPWANY